MISLSIVKAKMQQRLWNSFEEIQTIILKLKKYTIDARLLTIWHTFTEFINFKCMATSRNLLVDRADFFVSVKLLHRLIRSCRWVTLIFIQNIREHHQDDISTGDNRAKTIWRREPMNNERRDQIQTSCCYGVRLWKRCILPACFFFVESTLW
jgi:hypothetical protein